MKVLGKQRVFVLLLVAVAVFGGCRKREGTNAMSQPTARDLVKLYQRGAGWDDVAGEQLKKMGTQGRDELIAMLDDPTTSKEDSGTIILVLSVYFPGSESTQAMERCVSKIEDPNERETAGRIIRGITKTDPQNK
jgi:hypothetical protein